MRRALIGILAGPALAAFASISAAAAATSVPAPPQPAVGATDAAKCGGQDLKDEEVDAAQAACGRLLAAGGLSPDALRAVRMSDAALQVRRYQLDAAAREIDALLAAKPDDPAALVTRAALHTARDEKPAAMADLNAALKLDPHNVAALRDRAHAFARADETAKARADLDAILVLRPDDEQAWVERTLLAGDRDHVPEALAAADEAGKHLKPATALRLRGYVLENVGRGKDAAKAYDAAIKLDPADARSLQAKASLLHDLGQDTEALTLNASALALRPRYSAALRLRAEILLARSDWAGAQGAAQAASDAFSGDMSARLQLARALRGQDLHKRALSVLDDLVSRDPAAREGRFVKAQTLAALKRSDEAIAEYDRYIAGGDDAAARYNRGLLHADHDAHAAAAADFEAAASLDRKDPDALIELGLEQGALGKPEAAIASLNAALKRDPDNAWAFSSLGDAYSDRDDCRQAVVWYERAAKANAKDAGIDQAAAACYRKIGQDAAADRHVEHALKVDPATSWAWLDRGDRLLDKEKADKAAAVYSEGLKHAPNDVDLLVARGKAWETLKDLKRAGADFDAAVSAEPNSAVALNSRGLFHWRQDDNDLALADFDREIKLGEGGQIGYYNAGLAWRDKGRYDQALRQFDAYLELQPDDLDSVLQKGYVYKNLEDYLLAVEYFDAVIRADPKIAAAWRARGECKKELGDPSAEADTTQADRLDKAT